MKWLVVFALMMTCDHALAERRVALVLGNSAYLQVPSLINPGHDAQDLAAKLRNLDFEVIEGLNLDKNGMREILGEFAAALDGADVGLFFYAGHAIQLAGTNYLLPVDATVSRESDVYVHLLSLRDVMATMEAGVETRLIFLDACRDNPLARSLAQSLPASRSASVGSGLARMQAPVGTLIAYSTAPDATALDGNGRNSPFTTALLEYIGQPGMEARQVLTRVRRGVIDATNGTQVPWDSSSLSGDFYFRLEISNSPLSTPTQPADKAEELSPLDGESRLSLSTADKQELQSMLALLGHDPGIADGRFGPTTRRAIARWQSSAGLPSNGYLNEESYSALLIGADPAIQARERLLDGSAFNDIDIDGLLSGKPDLVVQMIELLDQLFDASSAETDFLDYLERLRAGDYSVSLNMGWRLQQSTRIPDLPRVAALLFALGAGQGLADGHAALAGYYYDGNGVPVDMVKSYRLFEHAAEAGIPDGYHGIGLHHQWGTAGLDTDIDKAIDYYKLSTRTGYPWGNIALGDIYRKGEQVAKNVEKARYYYKQIIDNDQPVWAARAVERAREGLAELEGQQQ